MLKSFRIQETASVAPKTYLNLIAGEWVPAKTGKTFENINPARRSDVVGTFQSSAAEDVAAAVDAAAGQTADPQGDVESSLLQPVRECLRRMVFLERRLRVVEERAAQHRVLVSESVDDRLRMSHGGGGRH